MSRSCPYRRYLQLLDAPCRRVWSATRRRNPSSRSERGGAETTSVEFFPVTAQRLAESVSTVIFLTNGEKMLFWDRERYPEREVSGFFTRADLERLAYQKRYTEPLTRVEINTKIAGRDY